MLPRNGSYFIRRAYQAKTALSGNRRGLGSSRGRLTISKPVLVPEKGTSKSFQVVLVLGPLSHKMNQSKLGEWMIIVNGVFERNIDFRKFFFDEPFNSRLCEIISFDLDEINKNTKSLLRKAVEETLRDPNFDFSISSSIWTQRDESDQNVDWAKKNLR